ncbi:MAG: MBL fold metallo-hydrolase [Theionarchaea archaeon]|nr:MBL fold metallo-hydrolase [Theionarchaea archaeon]
METQEITENITMIKGENQGRFPFSHSFLIEDDITALIDTGCGIRVLKQLKNIDIVVNSHSHPDHTAGNWLFSGLPLQVPQEEIDYNSNVKKLSERYAGKKLAGVWRDFVQEIMGFQNAQPTVTFRDKDVLDFGNIKLEAVHTPGHTAGHYCFFEKKERILFSFDIDFTGFGPWYGHVESDIDQFKTSVEKVRALKPEIVVSSHKGLITEDIQDGFARFLQVFQERDERILDFLEQERTLEEIVDSAQIYRDFSFHPLLLRYWEENMVCKHLENLVNTGLVRKTPTGFVACSNSSGA